MLKIDIKHQTVHVYQEWSKLMELVYLVTINVNFVMKNQINVLNVLKVESIHHIVIVKKANTLKIKPVITVIINVKNVPLLTNVPFVKVTE